MIKSIDEFLCRGCGLCEDICPMDVFRISNGKIHIAYQDDCIHCLYCLDACPMEAILFAPGVPKKNNDKIRWEEVKAAIMPEKSN